MDSRREGCLRKAAAALADDAAHPVEAVGSESPSFNSRFTNQRTDEYGGSTLNRGRFMRELIDAIKLATPGNPLVVRLNGAELMDRWGGNSEDECFELMQQAVDAGVDMISVTVGWQEAPESSLRGKHPPAAETRFAHGGSSSPRRRAGRSSAGASKQA